jgi:hypothetical protein
MFGNFIAFARGEWKSFSCSMREKGDKSRECTAFSFARPPPAPEKALLGSQQASPRAQPPSPPLKSIGELHSAPASRCNSAEGALLESVLASPMDVFEIADSLNIVIQQGDEPYLSPKAARHDTQYQQQMQRCAKDLRLELKRGCHAAQSTLDGAQGFKQLDGTLVVLKGFGRARSGSTLAPVRRDVSLDTETSFEDEEALAALEIETEDHLDKRYMSPHVMAKLELARRHRCLPDAEVKFNKQEIHEYQSLMKQKFEGMGCHGAAGEQFKRTSDRGQAVCDGVARYFARCRELDARYAAPGDGGHASLSSRDHAVFQMYADTLRQGGR